MFTNEELKKVKWLSFRNEKSILDDVHITGNPMDYLDLAEKLESLKFIKVEGTSNAEFYKAFTEFVRKCNEKVKISTDDFSYVDKENFLQGKKKIEKILTEIKPYWSTKQKLAFVHYIMGQIVSYVPDFKFINYYTDTPLGEDARNIWKAVNSGLSVCNGITSIQRNILSRIGIKTRELSSGTHSFLLTETEQGNIISDATWDLENTLYEARPQYFGVTYEELRKREEGISNAHRLKDIPENVIEISEEELREIYHSIGLTNEDRRFKFPILTETQKIKEKGYYTVDIKLDDFFNMFSEKFSKEATHLSETRFLLEGAISELGISINQISSRFVYNKDDINSEKPYLVFHISEGSLEDKMILLKPEEKTFKKFDIKEFDEYYKVHKNDTSEPFWKKNRESGIQKEEEKEFT